MFTASCKADRPPFVVDAQVQPIMQQSEIYSGVYGNVNISLFPYANSGKKGVGIGLNGIQKTRDGDPLASSVTAQDAFTAVGPSYPASPVYQPAAAPAPTGYPNAAAPAPGYPQAAPAYAYPQAVAHGYPQQAPAVDPITGQPIPTGMPIMGM